MSNVLAPRPVRRALHTVLLASVAFLGLTCETSTSPGIPYRRSLSIIPVFDVAPPGAPAITLSSVRAVLYVGADSFIAIATFDGDSAILTFENIPQTGAPRDVPLRIAAVDAKGDTVFRADAKQPVGAGTTGPAGGTTSGQSTQTITLVYTAPDAQMTSMTIAPRDTSVTTSDTVRLRLSGKKSDGSTVSTIRAAWASRDTAALQVTDSGTVKPRNVGRAVWIVATAYNGVLDSIRVTLKPVAGKVSLGIPGDSTSITRKDSLQLTATSYDAGNIELPTQAATWSSSNANIVSVSTTGKVKGVAIGVATISATIQGVTGTAKISVGPLAVDTVFVSAPNALVETEGTSATLVGKGQTSQFSAAAYTAGVRNIDNTVYWVANDPTIATVDQTGKVTAVSEGIAIMLAAAGAKNTFFIITVTNLPVVAVGVSPKTATINRNATVQLTVSAKAADSSVVTTKDRNGNVVTLKSDSGFTWTSSNPGIARVSTKGLVTGITAGTVKIYVDVPTVGKKDSATITVTSQVGSANPAQLMPFEIGASSDRFVADNAKSAGEAKPERQLLFDVRPSARHGTQR